MPGSQGGQRRNRRARDPPEKPQVPWLATALVVLPLFLVWIGFVKLGIETRVLPPGNLLAEQLLERECTTPACEELRDACWTSPAMEEPLEAFAAMWALSTLWIMLAAWFYFVAARGGHWLPFAASLVVLAGVGFGGVGVAVHLHRTGTCHIPDPRDIPNFSVNSTPVVRTDTPMACVSSEPKTREALEALNGCTPLSLGFVLGPAFRTMCLGIAAAALEGCGLIVVLCCCPQALLRPPTLGVSESSSASGMDDDDGDGRRSGGAALTAVVRMTAPDPAMPLELSENVDGVRHVNQDGPNPAVELEAAAVV